MEKFMNRLTDMDWGWWPFLALRPAKDEKMTAARVAKMAVYFGMFYGALLYIALVIPQRGFRYLDAILYLVLMVVLFFVVYRLTFAYSWNRRAQRLQHNQTNNEVRAEH